MRPLAMTTLRFGGQWSCWVRLEHRVSCWTKNSGSTYRNMTMRNPDTYFLLAKVWISDCHVGYKSEGWDWDSDSLPQNCHHEVEQKIWKRAFRKIRTWKFDKKSGGHSQKKTSKNICAFAMWFWKLVSTSLPPWVGTWDQGLFLSSWCYCSTWSNLLEQDNHSEDWNLKDDHFGVALRSL